MPSVTATSSGREKCPLTLAGIASVEALFRKHFPLRSTDLVPGEAIVVQLPPSFAMESCVFASSSLLNGRTSRFCSGTEECRDHHSLLRGLLSVVTETGSTVLIRSLFMVFREGSAHVLAPEVLAQQRIPAAVVIMRLSFANAD